MLLQCKFLPIRHCEAQRAVAIQPFRDKRLEKRDKGIVLVAVPREAKSLTPTHLPKKGLSHQQKLKTFSKLPVGLSTLCQFQLQ